MEVKLQGKSREELLKLLEIAEEKKRRKRQFKKAFIPHQGQAEIISSDKFIRFVASGNGFGKTALLVNETVWACLGYNPFLKKSTSVPIRAIIVLDKPEKIQDSYLPEMRKWFDTEEWDLKKDGKPYISRIVFGNGSEIRFMFHNQDELTFEGIEATFIAFDEPFPRHIWVGLQRAARTKNREQRFLICGTPIGQPWMKEMLWDLWESGERNDLECFVGDSAENAQNLADGYLERFSKNLTEQERRTRLHGVWFNTEGYALAHLFDLKTHVLKDKPNIVVATVAIDPHPEKAHHACIVGCDKYGYLYYLNETQQKMVPREFARFLRKWYETWPVNDIICDSLGSTQYSGGEGFKSFIQVLQEEGVRVRPTTWEDKKDDVWIDRIRDALAVPEKENNFGQKIPKLRFLEGNEGIIRDIKTASWKKKRYEQVYEPKIDISDKDYLSCLKYALATNITPGKKNDKAFRRVKMPGTYGLRKR